MTIETEVPVARPTKRQAARRNKNGQARRTRPRRRQPRARNVNEMERVIRNLEKQIAELTSPNTIRSAVTGASSQFGDFASKASNQVGEAVADTLTQVAGRLFGGATSVTGAARAGTGAMRTISNELERRPFMTVAIALGIGFLAGLAGRREAA